MHCLANLELMPPIGLLRLRLLPVVVVVIVSSWNLIHGFNHIEVIETSDDPNCGQCDSRSVCVRLGNATGVSCVCLPGFALSASTGHCVLQEIPLNGLCDSRYECFNGGYCSNETSKCQCSSGYGGLMCELDINECAQNERICASFSCINLPGTFQCQCDFFHSGQRCQTISALGLFLLVISSIAVIFVVFFLVLFAIRTVATCRLSRGMSKERELVHPYLSTLTTGGILGDDRLLAGPSFIRPVGHRIYVPMEASFINGARFQCRSDENESNKHSNETIICQQR